MRFSNAVGSSQPCWLGDGADGVGDGGGDDAGGFGIVTMAGSATVTRSRLRATSPTGVASLASGEEVPLRARRSVYRACRCKSSRNGAPGETIAVSMDYGDTALTRDSLTA